MEFWWGLTVGAIAGANIGLVLAGLLAGSKREENSQEYLWDRLHMDEAVLDEERGKAPEAVRPSPDAFAAPSADF
jgi:hypothetical protein